MIYLKSRLIINYFIIAPNKANSTLIQVQPEVNREQLELTW